MDKIAPERRSANMANIRSKDTKPEIAVRRVVHGLGYRYRLHGKHLPGKPDLVFGPRKKVIFVHGCFWHQHAKCVDGRTPRSNSGYWGAKLKRNEERDAEQVHELRRQGWKVLTIWECETSDPDRLERTLKRFLDT